MDYDQASVLPHWLPSETLTKIHELIKYNLSGYKGDNVFPTFTMTSPQIVQLLVMGDDYK